MKRLYIETNHGHLCLVDAHITHEPRTWGDRVGTYVVAHGTVESSSETSRLFHATSTREMHPVGALVGYTIWREPRCDDAAADSWYVSTVSCG